MPAETPTLCNHCSSASRHIRKGELITSHRPMVILSVYFRGFVDTSEIFKPLVAEATGDGVSRLKIPSQTGLIQLAFGP
jgi:hypothetical protein